MNLASRMGKRTRNPGAVKPISRAVRKTRPSMTQASEARALKMHLLTGPKGPTNDTVVTATSC